MCMCVYSVARQAKTVVIALLRVWSVGVERTRGDKLLTLLHLLFLYPETEAMMKGRPKLMWRDQLNTMCACVLSTLHLVQLKILQFCSCLCACSCYRWLYGSGVI